MHTRLVSVQRCLLWADMAKQITQKTFDDVVWENISEFEMETQVAIDEAVQQFEAQVRSSPTEQL